VNDARRAALGYGLLVVAAGLNLRYPITSVASTLGTVSTQFGLDIVAAGALSSLPVLMLAVGAPLAPLLERRFGVQRTLLALSMLLAASLLLRPLGTLSLFVGTVVIGVAISGLSVLVPQLIRERLPGRAGLWSGVFSTSFGVSAALGAGLTVPLIAITGSLRAALAAWSIPAVVLVCLAATVARRDASRDRGAGRSGRAPTRAPRLRQTPLLWQVTVFFGAQALVFFAVTAWLPTLYVDRGVTPGHAAGLLALASIAGLPASLGVSLLAARVRRQHVIVAVVSLGSGIGLAGVAWAPVALAPVFVIVLGFAQGAAFGLGVALIVLKADPQAPVAPFSAFVQGVGYGMAALGPMPLGVLRWVGAPWPVAIAVLIGVVAVQAVAGWAAGRQVVAAVRVPAPAAPSKSSDSLCVEEVS
jgi:MFS transporter, CP family, cyanate transporter